MSRRLEAGSIPPLPEGCLMTLFTIFFAVGCQAADQTPVARQTILPDAPTATAAPIPAGKEATLPPLPIPSSTPTPLPPPTATVPPTAEVVRVRELPPVFLAILRPFIEEAKKQRAWRAAHDPEYADQVDIFLNDGLVNFVLFGWGETHEPPLTDKAIIGSQTIVSVDTKSGKVYMITFTHDTRAPEIEKALGIFGKKGSATRIDKAMSVGGFPLMRKVLEDATGLSIDYQIAFKDSLIRGLVDEVLGGIKVDNPHRVRIAAIYLDDQLYPQRDYPAGTITLSGLEVDQFIKGIPDTEDPNEEHNVRKWLVFDAILKQLIDRRGDKAFLLKSAAFFTKEMGVSSFTHEFETDFSLAALLLDNIQQVAPALDKLRAEENGDALMPEMESVYLVDPAHDISPDPQRDGVQWVLANAAVDPNTAADVEAGIYGYPPPAAIDMEVPVGSNARGDLVRDYWQSPRRRVAKFIYRQRGLALPTPTPER